MIALVEQGLNQELLCFSVLVVWFGFLKARDFSALSLAGEAGSSATADASSEKEGEEDRQGGGEEEGEEKVKSLPSGAVRICNKELGAGELFPGPGAAVSLPAKRRGSGAGETLLAPLAGETDFQERLFKKTQGTRTVTQATMSPDFSPCPL